jgi:hypothetical protein
MSSAFHNFFDIQPASKITNPEPTYQKNKGKSPQTDQNIGILPDVELEDFSSSKHNADKGVQTPKTPNALEKSRPATPSQNDAVGLMRTWNSPPMTKWRILCCCLIYFSNGINDSGTCDSDLHSLYVRLMYHS